MEDNLKFRAMEMLRSLGYEIKDSFTFEVSEQYPVLIKTNNKKELTYYFLIEDGELFYDGWGSKTCIPINDTCPN